MLEFAKVFEEAGFPPGVFNVISGLGEPCGRALTTHPLVDRISFTGGPETARHVVRNSAENFAQVSLELGGKSPVVVFDDADLESATNGVLLSIFSASGQSCVAGSRLLLHDSIHDEVLARVAEKASKIRIGDPLDDNSQMGPLATRAQLDNIDSTVADPKSQWRDPYPWGSTACRHGRRLVLRTHGRGMSGPAVALSSANSSDRWSVHLGLPMKPTHSSSPTTVVLGSLQASSQQISGVLSNNQGHSQWYCLGQYLPDGLTTRPIRWVQGQWLRPRIRP
ncbi:MAG: hypothetical protein CM1200mP18_12020 [Gammaproteobacteria bacterium]|nr:MAG: hypothetical protein CM1200mP18_12020 [Gammaproteobacteria bacterium]